MNTKECNICHQRKSLTEFQQHLNQCKRCKLDKDLARRREHHKNKVHESRRKEFGLREDGTKKCMRCKQVLPAKESFSKLTSRFDGYNYYCKKCRAVEASAEGSYISKMLSRARQRAKQANVPCTIQKYDITIPEVCPVLGIPLVFGHSEKKTQPEDNSPSLDRIIPELGYVPGNIAVISYRANLLKSNGTLEEHKMLVEWLQSLK